MITIDLKNNHFLISFIYNPDTVELIKALPDRRWDPKLKVWKVPASIDILKYLEENYSKSILYTPKLLSWSNEINSIQRQINHAQKFKEQVEIPNDYTFKTKPFEHQIKCFNFFKNLNIGGLFLEMGLGKTKIIIDVISYQKLMGNLNGQILYVCPNSVLENTKREFEMHSSLPFKICVLTGSRDKKIKLLSQDFDVYIINYEGLRTIKDELLKQDFECIICDESTRIKNPHAQCSKVLHKLGQITKYRYILTGTPITQSAIDIYSQYKFVEPSIFGHSFYAFKNRYTIMGGYLNKQIVGYRDLDDLQSKLFKTAIRFTKKECLDLPDKVYEVKQFDLNQEEKKLYKQMKDNLFIEIMNEKVTASLIITKILKLAEITSGFVKSDDDVNIKIQNCSKLNLLEETLEDILPNKTIIWCNFIANIKSIEAMLDKMKVKYVSFYGEVPQEKRQEAIDTFQQDDDCKVFIGQIKTGGLGLNLTSASYVVYFSNTYSLADRLQSEDRAHRIGQTNKVTYIDLIAKDTIEQSILKILQSKLEISRLIIDKQMVEKIVDGEL